MLKPISLFMFQAAIPTTAFSPGFRSTAQGHLASLKQFDKNPSSLSPRVNQHSSALMAKKNDNPLEDIFEEVQKHMPFGKKTNDNISKITFADVAGVDEAKVELAEIVEFLKNPEKFEALGAKVPKGVMLSGPPGTGKTLLAKAVAGEAGVSFYSASGSQFVEMFVGRGAARVRELFKKAGADSPSILFIDEIDAVGKKRSSDGAVSNDEREQTLNELLTQMDGFNSDSKIIVIAATNRVDLLDDALIRPGRFDRQLIIGLPDRHGREEILAVHAKNKPIAGELDLKEIALRTPGFSGADLANLLNEAAILAVRNNETAITSDDINNAIDRVIAGPAKLKHYISEDRKKLVAYHEAGHALVAAMLEEFDSVQKVSIVPRGNAAGLTWFTPNEEALDSGLYTHNYLKNRLSVALGGRVAEELVFGHGGVTTGASSDLMRVTQIARDMVKIYGMSSGMPQMNLNTHSDSGMVKGYSESVAKRIDVEVEKIVNEAHSQAKTILLSNRSTLNSIAHQLIKEETIQGSELDKIIANHTAGTKLDNFMTALFGKIKLILEPTKVDASQDVNFNSTLENKTFTQNIDESTGNATQVNTTEISEMSNFTQVDFKNRSTLGNSTQVITISTPNSTPRNGNWTQLKPDDMLGNNIWQRFKSGL